MLKRRKVNVLSAIYVSRQVIIWTQLVRQIVVFEMHAIHRYIALLFIIVRAVRTFHDLMFKLLSLVCWIEVVFICSTRLVLALYAYSVEYCLIWKGGRFFLSLVHPLFNTNPILSKHFLAYLVNLYQCLITLGMWSRLVLVVVEEH